MVRRGQAPIDPQQYIRIRINQLMEERAKNADDVTHMILDKCVSELSIVLDLIQRNNEKEKTQ